MGETEQCANEDGCAIVEQERNRPQKIQLHRVDKTDDTRRGLEKAPKVDLESQGEKPTDNHKTPEQHTPFCLGYGTGALESGLSADAELREKKGGWLVRHLSLWVFSESLQ